MSFQDGRRVEALEAAVRELRETMHELAASMVRQSQRIEDLTRSVVALQNKLNDRPALARRHA